MNGTAPSLRQIELWMQTALQHPGSIVPQEAESLLLASPGLSGQDGLAIYQRSYSLRISSCMREQFPALCHALGEALFNDFVDEYIRVKPPESHTLYDLGRRFQGYMEETRPDREMLPADREIWIDFMVDLAAFERQLYVLFDAPGNEGNAFADTSTPEDRLALQPGLDIGTYRFAVAEYYHAVRKGLSPELPGCERSHYAMVRSNYLTRTIILNEPHYIFLEAMRSGASVRQSITTVARHLGIPEETVRNSWNEEGGVRQRWLDAGFFVDRPASP